MKTEHVNQKSKLRLKRVSNPNEEFGIHSLDRFREAGSYTWIAKDVTEKMGFPSCIKDTDDCLFCEGQLFVMRHGAEETNQSTDSFGQVLTMINHETGNTNIFTRSLHPLLDNGDWTKWQMVATGDPKLIAENNNINEILSALRQQIEDDSKRIDSAENSLLTGTTVRFHRIEENEATVNAGVVDTVKEVVYYKAQNKFVAADSTGNYWDTWDGMDAYMSGGAIRHDKVYLCGDEAYFYSNLTSQLAGVNSTVYILAAFSNAPSIKNASDYVYNKATKEVNSINIYGVVTSLPKRSNQLFIWENDLYVWNADLTELVPVNETTRNELLYNSWQLSTLGDFVNATFQVSNGALTYATTSILSIDYFKTGTVFAKPGYKIRAIAYYKEDTLEYDSSIYDIAEQSFKVEKAGCVARILIKRDDNNEFTPEEYLDGNFLNLYLNSISKTLPLLVEKTQHLSSTTREEIVAMKFGLINNFGRITLETQYEGFLNHQHSGLYDITQAIIKGCQHRTHIQLDKSKIIRVRPASTLAGTPSVGDEVATIPEEVGGWSTKQLSVKAGEKYVVDGQSGGGSIPLIAVINSRNILTQYIPAAYTQTSMTINIAEDGIIVVNVLDDRPYSLYKVTNQEFSCHWYDKDMFYLGISSMDMPPKDAIYLRLSIIKEQDVKSEDTMILQFSGDIKRVYEKAEPLQVHRAYYPVEVYNTNSINKPEDGLQDSAELTYDIIKFILPPNYDPKGEPVRLVIYVQGSGGSLWTDIHFDGSDNSRRFYIANEGYAIMMINGITAKYHTLYPEVNDNFATPISMTCYEYALKWITEHFNIRRDGVFVYGKSLGGLGVGNLMYSKLPVLAAAGLAPALDAISEIMRNRDAQAKQFYAEQFGMTGDITFSDRPVSAENRLAENAYFKANAHKVIGYNPIWNGVIGLDTDALLAETYKHPFVQTGVEIPEERALYESLPKISSVPLKIWIARDDVNVDPRFCDYFQKMCQKGSSYYQLRWMPEGTGGHWAVDRGNEVNGVFQEPIKATVTPKYSNEAISVAVAYIEMVAWFRRFEV